MSLILMINESLWNVLFDFGTEFLTPSFTLKLTAATWLRSNPATERRPMRLKCTSVSSIRGRVRWKSKPFRWLSNCVVNIGKLDCKFTICISTTMHDAKSLRQDWKLTKLIAIVFPFPFFLNFCFVVGCSVSSHVVHLSCAETIPLIAEAKRQGLPLTVETCPHYLTLAAEDVPLRATQFKCCPPIRDRDNQVDNYVLGM